jgi:hypothetical protein
MVRRSRRSRRRGRRRRRRRSFLLRGRHTNKKKRVI